MRIRKKTPQQRLTEASTAVTVALDAFEQAATALDNAAEEAAAVVTEVETQVQELTQVRDSAYRQRASYEARANKIREFVK